MRSAGFAMFLLACGAQDDRCDAEACVDVPELPWVGTGSAGRGEVGFRIAVDERGFLAVDGLGCVYGAWVEPGEAVVECETEGEVRIGLTSLDDLLARGIQEPAATDALAVFTAAWERGDTERLDYVITDFSQHSSQPRQWIFDLASEELLFQLHVAHGRGYNEPFMDTAFPPGFSNTPETHLSSLGVMRSGERYVGMYGSSHRIDGLEPDLNDNVRDRAIVMHPSTGSRPEFVAEHGEVQPTWGCPALDDRIAPMVAERESDGVLMFFWHPEWRASSRYLAP